MKYALSSFLVIITAVLMLPAPSNSEDYGISGTWYYGNMPTHIRVESKNRIMLDNGEGSDATGFFTDPLAYKSPGMEGGRTGYA